MAKANACGELFHRKGCHERSFGSHLLHPACCRSHHGRGFRRGKGVRLQQVYRSVVSRCIQFTTRSGRHVDRIRQQLSHTHAQRSISRRRTRGDALHSTDARHKYRTGVQRHLAHKTSTLALPHSHRLSGHALPLPNSRRADVGIELLPCHHCRTFTADGCTDSYSENTDKHDSVHRHVADVYRTLCLRA